MIVNRQRYNPYRLLGLSRGDGATTREIRSAYLAAMNRYHPDKKGRQKELTAEEMKDYDEICKLLPSARDFLLDKRRRFVYDHFNKLYVFKGQSEPTTMQAMDIASALDDDFEAIIKKVDENYAGLKRSGLGKLSKGLVRLEIALLAFMAVLLFLPISSFCITSATVMVLIVLPIKHYFSPPTTTPPPKEVVKDKLLQALKKVPKMLSRILQFIGIVVLIGLCAALSPLIGIIAAIAFLSDSSVRTGLGKLRKEHTINLHKRFKNVFKTKNKNNDQLDVATNNNGSTRLVATVIDISAQVAMASNAVETPAVQPALSASTTWPVTADSSVIFAGLRVSPKQSHMQLD